MFRVVYVGYPGSVEHMNIAGYGANPNPNPNPDPDECVYMCMCMCDKYEPLCAYNPERVVSRVLTRLYS